MTEKEKNRRGRPTLERPNVSLTLTISRELHKRALDYITEDDRTMSYIARKGIEMYLESKGK